MALAIDGTPVGGNISGSQSSLVLPGLTTTQSNDIIIVQYVEDGVSDASTTVTSPHLTFTKRASNSTPVCSEWYAVASGPLTSEVITITLAGAVTYLGGCAFAISGANTGTIWDSNGSIPNTGVTGADPTFSTNAANTIVIGAMGTTVTSPTSGSGWTTIYNAGAYYFISQYQIFSSPQTGTACSLATGHNDQNRYVVDAIVQAGSTAYALACAYGTYAETGEAVAFTIGTSTYLLPLGAGAYDVVGSPAYSDVGLSAAFGSYAITGEQIALTGVSLNPAAGSYALTGGSVTFTQTFPTPTPLGVHGGPGHVYSRYSTGMIYTRYN